MTNANSIASLTPKGMFMCCICFDYFPEDQAYISGNGDRWNVCPQDIDQMYTEGIE